jgi:hypothetical protein
MRQQAPEPNPTAGELAQAYEKRLIEKHTAPLREFIHELLDHLDYCGWGDRWERECSEDTSASVSMARTIVSALPETCCGGTRSRIGCEYHDPALQPAAALPEDARKARGLHLGRSGPAAGGEWDLSPNGPPPIQIDLAGDPVIRGVSLPAGARLLGLDDPEVLGPDTPPELIYLDPATGGVVGVPQTASAAAATMAAWQRGLVAEEIARAWVSAHPSLVEYLAAVNHGRQYMCEWVPGCRKAVSP